MENTNSTEALDKRNEERTELVRGLRELAGFLAAHPEVPFPKHLSTGTNWWDGSEEPDDAKCIARIEAWKALGFKDDWPTSGEGHHGVKVKFGGFELRLSYVEDGKSRPIAWSKNVGESDKDFQARVDAALEAVAE